MPDIQLATTDAQVLACHPVMRQLRPHVTDPQVFLAQVRRQEAAHGYRIASLSDNGAVVAVAGYRLDECLSRGRFLYVDDLVTDEAHRSRGFGDRLFDWLVEQARAAECNYFVLDSGVQRLAAHRFYFRKRMEIGAYNFRMKL